MLWWDTQWLFGTNANAFNQNGIKGRRDRQKKLQEPVDAGKRDDLVMGDAPLRKLFI
jgi:hypothetical protein